MASTKNPENFDEATPVRSTSELARRLGLSRWTVSRILNGHDGVHPETAERVRAAMREHSFSPSPLAQGLRRGRTNIIGVCVPEIEDYHLGPKLESLRLAISRKGLHPMIGMTGGEPATEAETLDHFRHLRVAGVVTFASRLPAKSAAIRHLKDSGIPLLRVDPMDASQRGGIGLDRAFGMKEATRHLLALGHRRLATIGIDSEGAYTAARFEAIRQVQQESSLQQRSQPDLLRIPLPPCASYYQAGRDAARSLLAIPDSARPTGLLVLNDRAAIGLIEGLRTAGRRVPEDFSVVGYDNMEAGAFFTPKLTTIDLRPEELIEKVSAHLLPMLDGEGELPPGGSRIRTRLIVRESTASATRT